MLTFLRIRTVFKKPSLIRFFSFKLFKFISTVRFTVLIGFWIPFRSALFSVKFFRSFIQAGKTMLKVLHKTELKNECLLLRSISLSFPEFLRS